MINTRLFCFVIKSMKQREKEAQAWRHNNTYTFSVFLFCFYIDECNDNNMKRSVPFRNLNTGVNYLQHTPIKTDVFITSLTATSKLQYNL